MGKINLPPGVPQPDREPHFKFQRYRPTPPPRPQFTRSDIVCYVGIALFTCYFAAHLLYALIWGAWS